MTARWYFACFLKAVFYNVRRWCVATKLWMCRMSFSEILIVAFALAVDALVCSIITGKSSTNRLSRIVTGLTVALTFGFFQFLMLVIGFFAGKLLENTLAAVDHWIAFGSWLVWALICSKKHLAPILSNELRKQQTHPTLHPRIHIVMPCCMLGLFL